MTRFSFGIGLASLFVLPLVTGTGRAGTTVYEVNATYLVQSVERFYFNDCDGGPGVPNCGDLESELEVGNLLLATYRYSIDDASESFNPTQLGGLRLSLYEGASPLGSRTFDYTLTALNDFDLSTLDPDLPGGSSDAIVATFELIDAGLDEEVGDFGLFGNTSWFEDALAGSPVDFGRGVDFGAFSTASSVVFESNGNTVFEEFAGGFQLSVDIRPVGQNNGSSPSNPLLPVLPVDPDDPVFVFEVPPDDVIAGVPIWIDPYVSIGYDYTVVNAEIGAITAPTTSMVADADGYTVTIDGVDYALLPGDTLDLELLGLSGVDEFTLSGIDPTLALDPLDDMAFMLGITPVNFSATEPITFTQAPIIAGLIGDYDDSGSVEQGDLNLVLNNWGQDAPFDSNGAPFTTPTVDQEELNRVLNNWGSTSVPSFAGFDIPEPTSLLVLAMCGLRRRRA